MKHALALGAAILGWVAALPPSGCADSASDCDRNPLLGCGRFASGVSAGGTAGAGGGISVNCGDHHLDPGEGCDDGNNVNADGCEANCTLPSCNNGVVDPGEVCFLDPPQIYPTTLPGSKTLSLVDCDGDGDVDVITGNKPAGTGTGAVSLLTNDGSGVFAFKHALDTPNLATGVMTARDIDGSGKPTIVAMQTVGTNPHAVLFRNVEGCGDTVAATDIMTVSSMPSGSVVAVRFIQSGIATRLEPAFITAFGIMLMPNGNTFDYFEPFPAANDVRAMASGPVSGTSGTPDDLVFVDHTTQTLYLVPIVTTTPFWSAGPTGSTATGASAVVVANVYGAEQQVITANPEANAVTVIEPAQAFAENSFPTTGTSGVSATGPAAIAAGDIDNDGRTDIVSGNDGGGTGSVSLLLSDGLSTLSSADPPEGAKSPIAVLHVPSAVELADLNDDGALDIVTLSASNAGTSFVTVLVARP